MGMTETATRAEAEPQDSLPTGLLELLRQPSPAFIATLMPDGSPQMTRVWVDTDGEHVLINTVQGNQKSLNIARDPRVVLCICDPSDINRFYQVRGHVIAVTRDGAVESVNRICLRYRGTPYPNPGFTGRPETRLLVTIAVDFITPPLFG
jgi:PPOX class probable F420-dependent enzyme